MPGCVRAAASARARHHALHSHGRPEPRVDRRHQSKPWIGWFKTLALDSHEERALFSGRSTSCWRLEVCRRLSPSSLPVIKQERVAGQRVSPLCSATAKYRRYTGWRPILPVADFSSTSIFNVAHPARSFAEVAVRCKCCSAISPPIHYTDDAFCSSMRVLPNKTMSTCSRHALNLTQCSRKLCDLPHQARLCDLRRL